MVERNLAKVEVANSSLAKVKSLDLKRDLDETEFRELVEAMLQQKKD